MKMKNVLAVALVVAIALSLSLVSTSHAQFFTASLAADFAADFTGVSPAGQPVNNPLPATGGGSWTFYAEGDLQGVPTVVSTLADVGAGVGSGWDDPGHGIGGYARGGPHGIGPGAGDSVVQHTIGGGSVSKIDYLVPLTATYNFAMNIQQTNFEAARANRFELYQNDFALAGAALASVDATLGGTGPVPGVNGGISGVALNAGDIITLVLSAQGAGGDGAGTFVGVNLIVEAVPEPASMALTGLGLSSILMMSRRRR